MTVIVEVIDAVGITSVLVAEGVFVLVASFPMVFTIAVVVIVVLRLFSDCDTGKGAAQATRNIAMPM
jgi:hypothetical protein